MRINKQLVTYASVGVLAVAAIATSAAIGPIWAPQAPAPAEISIVEPAEVVETPTPTPTVAPTPTPTPEPVVEAPAPPPPAPVKCPAGSEATHIDDAGNESGCIPKNNDGETCQAINDAGECTAWASLDARRLEPTL